MRATLVLLAAACLLALLPGSSAAGLTLGTNLGLMIFDPSGGGNSTTVIEVPSSAAYLQPGLRVGCRFTDPHHEIYLNTGFISVSHSGADSHIFEGSLNYEYDLTPEEAASAYLTAGGGLLSVGGTGETSSTSGLFGGGLGVRFRVAEGHGSLRAEGRYDHLGESHSISKGSIFGIRLGFDLWMK